MKEAIEGGVPLIGYTTWGPIDLVSAGTGQYAKRYGFIYVDRHDDGTGDFSRSKKDSFYWYKKVCESNGEEIQYNKRTMLWHRPIFLIIFNIRIMIERINKLNCHYTPDNRFTEDNSHILKTWN